MQRAIIALAAAACLAAPANAHAGWKTNRAVAIAQIVWQPSCGPLRLSFETPAPDDAEEGVNAWAWPDECVIHLDNRQRWEWEPLCETVLHETGHVTGLADSKTPGNIMFNDGLTLHDTGWVNGKWQESWTGIDKRCRKRGRPFLERHLTRLVALAVAS